jgi:hypothetical protein
MLRQFVLTLLNHDKDIIRLNEHLEDALCLFNA